MSNQELIERYIYVATKRLPSDSRADTMRELESLIADMLQERCKDNEPTEADLRAVLTELGHPDELAARYSNGPTALIEQPYLTQYWNVLRIVMISVGGATALALMIAAAVNPQEQLGIVWSVDMTMQESSQVIGKLIGTVTSGVMSGLLQAFAWVTGIFAVMSYRGVKLRGDSDFLNDLPELPANRQPISKVGSIFGLVMSVVFSVIFIAFPQVICVYSSSYSVSAMPVFDTVRMSSVWVAILGIGIVGLVSNCAELIEGYRTRRLLVINLGCNLLFAVCAVVWLGNGSIISEQFRVFMHSVMGDGVGYNFMHNLNLVVLGAILLGIVVDSIVDLWELVAARNR